MHKKIYIFISILFVYTNCYFCNCQTTIKVNLNTNTILIHKEVFHKYSQALLFPQKKQLLKASMDQDNVEFVFKFFQKSFVTSLNPLSDEERVLAISYFLNKHKLNPTINETLDLGIITFSVLVNSEVYLL